MQGVTVKPLAVAALAVGAALMAYAWATRRPGQSLASSIGSGAVTAVNDVASGVVVGVGEVFGIPATSKDQCTLDLEAGRTWDASFSCPAGRFIKEGLFS